MSLFAENHIQNLLPNDGVVYYYGKIFSIKDASHYFNILLNTIDWKNDEVMIFGKKIITKRKAAWYGEEGLSYTYSKITKQPLAFTKELLELKKIVEEISGTTYNSCLLNLYHNGGEAMGWHSDDEKELLQNGTIASVSFGAERKFIFRHKKTKETVGMMLENGSLLCMKDVTQTYWQHRLTPSAKITTARINLTFRTIA